MGAWNSQAKKGGGRLHGEAICDCLWINHPYAAFCQNWDFYMARKFGSCWFRWYLGNLPRTYSCEDKRVPIIASSNSEIRETRCCNVSVILLRILRRSRSCPYCPLSSRPSSNLPCSLCHCKRPQPHLTARKRWYLWQRYTLLCISPYSCSVHKLKRSWALLSRKRRDAWAWDFAWR